MAKSDFTALPPAQQRELLLNVLSSLLSRACSRFYPMTVVVHTKSLVRELRLKPHPVTYTLLIATARELNGVELPAGPHTYRLVKIRVKRDGSRNVKHTLVFMRVK